MPLFTAFPYDFAANEKRLNLTEALSRLEPQKRRTKIIDVYEKECAALGGKLDRVLGRGFDRAQSQLVPAVAAEECLGSYREADIKEYVVRQARQQRKPAFASDHQPLVARFSYKKPIPHAHPARN